MTDKKGNGMVYRIFVEKKAELANEAAALLGELKSLLSVKNLNKIRIFNRYDVENVSEEIFEKSKNTVFSEPQTDLIYDTLPEESAKIFAVEYLPGQYDQRADSAAQCIQIMSQKERPAVKTAKVYMLFGDITDEELLRIQKYVINPVESRLASLECYTTLDLKCEIPTEVETLDGFTELDDEGLKKMIDFLALAMDFDDIKFCQKYFKKENRNPTITEIRMIDTYWSDHCRHTTFLTTIDEAVFEDKLHEDAYNRYLETRKSLNRTKPQNLMDIATIAVKALRKSGQLDKLDESEEINACTVKTEVDVGGKKEQWLLLFKNETHNHPTEIEPFGGAATCIGGAIRDPLSGRAYVYQAMRVTGAANPLMSVADTIKGKLPQRKIVTTAAAGYSSYGNQIGLATGQVDEIYHDGYAAKRMEIGAVVAAVPAENVRREVPEPGDAVILLGGRTGRDGCGGATGSSKSHKLDSLEKCGAEVQKGNAPEERKLQRLFRNPEASRLIKRCNDFGAGGVSVAIGELADGLYIDLNKVPKKYEGLDGTELAISESQERMAVVVERKDVPKFIELAESENLEATEVAEVRAEPRLKMNWNGKNIVDLSREFLNSNGAEKHIKITVSKPESYEKNTTGGFAERYRELAQDLNVCSKRGLSERFDSTIGANTVLMPFGGKYQMTPTQAMAAKIPTLEKETTTCSVMSWGYNPFITSKSPYHGAYLAVIESVAKLVATGAPLDECYLTFQEYFEKPMTDARRWGKPLAALLGAFDAQMELGFGAIGGKDSMSGSFENIDVPPTLVSFAVALGNTRDIVSPEFKKSGSSVRLIRPKLNEKGLPDAKFLLKTAEAIHELIQNGTIISAYTPTYGGIAEGIMKMCMGNRIGCKIKNITENELFGYSYGAFVIETDKNCKLGEEIGETIGNYYIEYNNSFVDMTEMEKLYENKLEPIFSCNIAQSGKPLETVSYKTEKRISPSIKTAKPKILIPVFPGTNCEYDTAKQIIKAGGEPEIFVINNLTSAGVTESVNSFAEKINNSQIIFIPGGFSGGDEPDGSGKFITAFFRNPKIADSVNNLLKNRDGLMAGICNGFQALIKLGLVPYGKIVEAEADGPTLTYNIIGRHQSRLVRTRISSNKSPWLAQTEVGEVYTVAISHGEGRFICNDELMKKLIANGQIATQYVDFDSNPTYDIHFNPNGSDMAVEGITSPDGRILGKMGHSERIGDMLYKNVPGSYDINMFDSAVKYFK